MHSSRQDARTATVWHGWCHVTVRARLIGTWLAFVALALAAPAHAYADTGFQWRAPTSCPDVDQVRERIERRLGTSIDGTVHGIAIAIDREGADFVARIDMRGVTVANEMRTLTSARCDDLADAVAVVVARLATEARHADEQRAARAAAATLAARGTTARRGEPLPGPWGGGVRALALSGIGAVPRVGVGGELAGFARFHRWFGEVAAARWATSPKYLVVGAPGRVDIHLTTLSARAGWLPTHMPLRAWIGGEMGPMSARGIDLVESRMTSTRWISAQAGFGVAWQMARRARLVGTFEIGVPLVRPQFVLAEGGEIFRPYPTTARCAFGLEMGWR